MNAPLDAICSRLVAAVTQAQGPVLVLGEPGIGKTTLLGKLRWYLRPSPTVLFTAEADTSIDAILRATCATMEVTLGPAVTRADAVRSLADKSIALAKQGAHATILVDDGEKLDIETLLALHQLAELRSGERRLFPIVIAARPEFEAILTDLRLAGLRRGFAASVSVPGLAAEEVAAFVAHQLRSAAGSAEVKFANDAIELASAQSSGNPQILNLLCAQALTSAALEGSHTVSLRHMELAVRQCAPRPSAEVRVLRPDASLVVEAAKLATGLRVALGGSSSILFEDDALATAGIEPSGAPVDEPSIPLKDPEVAKAEAAVQKAIAAVPDPARRLRRRRIARRFAATAAAAAALGGAAWLGTHPAALPTAVAQPLAAAPGKAVQLWHAGVSWTTSLVAIERLGPAVSPQAIAAPALRPEPEPPAPVEAAAAAPEPPAAPVPVVRKESAEAVFAAPSAPTPAVPAPPPVAIAVSLSSPPAAADPTPPATEVALSVSLPPAAPAPAADLAPALPPAQAPAALDPAPAQAPAALDPAPPPTAAVLAASLPLAAPVPAPAAVAPFPAAVSRPAATAIPAAILLTRGDQLLRTGDLVAARLFYERGAEQGHGPSATALARTYDPLVLKEQAVRGARGDREAALSWYRRALELGDTAASARLEALLRF
jgi:type II secretory pathway predicted ATPase ExeA